MTVKGFYEVPEPSNEPVLSYAPGSKERAEVKAALRKMRGLAVDIPMVIGGREVFTGRKVEIRPPHELARLLGHYSDCLLYTSPSPRD